MESAIEEVRNMSTRERMDWAESMAFSMSLSDICEILELADESED